MQEPETQCYYHRYLPGITKVICKRPALSKSPLCTTHDGAAHSFVYKMLHDTLGNRTLDFSRFFDDYVAIRSRIHIHLILSYILTVKTLHEIMTDMGITYNISDTKTALIWKFTDLYEKMYMIYSDSRKIRGIGRFQKAWRNRRAAVAVMAAKTVTFVNSDDPFTSEPIEAISPGRLFSYEDSSGHLYGFSAPHLYKSLTEWGAFNPFTREPLPDSVISELIHRVNTMRDDRGDDMAYGSEDSPYGCYMAALYELDRMGFYTKIDWLSDLTMQDIKTIYLFFNRINDVPTDSMKMAPFKIVFREKMEDVQMHFGKDLQKTIAESEPDTRLRIACNILVSIANVSKKVRMSLPTWVFSASALLYAGQ